MVQGLWSVVCDLRSVVCGLMAYGCGRFHRLPDRSSVVPSTFYISGSIFCGSNSTHGRPARNENPILGPPPSALGLRPSDFELRTSAIRLRPSASAVLRLAFSGLVLLSAPGCASLYQRTIASEDVVSCRERWQQGVDATQRGDWDAAVELFRSATQVCPEDARARSGLAEALWHCSQQGEALSEMNEAIRLAPENFSYHVRTGEMHLEREEIDVAETSVERALALGPHTASVWSLKGDVHFQRDEMESALQSYYRAIFYQPHYPHAQLQIAKIYQRQNRPQRALTTLQMVTDQSPPGTAPLDVLYQTALAYKALGRTSEAADCLAIVARRGSPGPELLYELAEAQLSAGRTGRAWQTATSALQLDPGHLPSRDLMARVELHQRTE